MERKYQVALARSAGRPISSARQLLRALREAGFVRGHHDTPTPIHIARILMALSADTVTAAPDRVRVLRTLPLRTPCGLPTTVETMLTRLVEIVNVSPVMDEFDVDGGSLHLGPTWVTLECLSLTGKRAAVRYGDPIGDTVTASTTIPISTIREITNSILEKS
jgi:hypothetical protein